MDLKEIFEQVLNETKLDKRYTVAYRKPHQKQGFEGCLNTDGKLCRHGDKNVKAFDTITDAKKWATDLTYKSSDYTVDSLCVVDEMSGKDGKDCNFYSLWDLDHSKKDIIKKESPSFFDKLFH